MSKWGFFITFEGIEGSGKSTLARRCYDFFQNVQIPVIWTREPGGTEVGEKIREILLSENLEMDPYTELFLFLSARKENIKRVIIPYLQKGYIVISDRFDDSSFAYQGLGRGIPQKTISRLNKTATGGIKPALTFLVDIPVEEALKRVKQPFDRIEKEEIEFHKNVRKGYLLIAKRAKKRVKVIDGTNSPEQNLKICLNIILQRLMEKKKFLKNIEKILKDNPLFK